VAEGDTVHAIATRLGEALHGRELTRTDIRVPRFATADLSGRRIDEVAARGKHLLIRTTGETSIHSHLGMDGAWHLYETGARWRGPDCEVRAVLHTDRWIAVGHRLRRLDVLDTEREAQILGHLGPDVLGPEWHAPEATRRLTSAPERPLGEALIDQAVMAGPGNVYRSEVCFLAGIDPRTRGDHVRDPRAVVELMKSLMEANRGGGRRVTTGDRRRGRELWVYGRGGRPCRRCGTLVRAFRLGPAGEERVIYACPTCQRSTSASPT
jgi:endonuclease VIII